MTVPILQMRKLLAHHWQSVSWTFHLSTQEPRCLCGCPLRLSSHRASRQLTLSGEYSVVRRAGPTTKGKQCLIVKCALRDVGGYFANGRDLHGPIIVFSDNDPVPCDTAELGVDE